MIQYYLIQINVINKLDQKLSKSYLIILPKMCSVIRLSNIFVMYFGISHGLQYVILPSSECRQLQ